MHLQIVWISTRALVSLNKRLDTDNMEASYSSYLSLNLLSVHLSICFAILPEGFLEIYTQVI